jgi:hypothetical protein
MFEKDFFFMFLFVCSFFCLFVALVSPSVQAILTPAHHAVVLTRDHIYKDCIALFQMKRNSVRIEMRERYEEVENWRQEFEMMTQQLLLTE